MTVGRFATQYSIVGAIALVSLAPSRAMAQDFHPHMGTSQNQDRSPDQKNKANALVQIVRDATDRFQNVADAEREGYALQFGCVSGPDVGAMGLHYVNGDLVNKGVLDPRQPQILIYEAVPNHRPKLIGADFLVDKVAWDAAHDGPPELMGQFFHLFDAPNRFGLAAFYSLHVWAWKDNPNGTFVNWHPNVSCDAFNGQGR